jgi:hypothetical protein
MVAFLRVYSKAWTLGAKQRSSVYICAYIGNGKTPCSLQKDLL